MSTNSNSYPALPAPERDDPEDESPYKKLYVAIDGVEYDDFTQEEREQLQQRLIEYLLMDAGKPITDVRVVADGKGVVEYDEDALDQ